MITIANNSSNKKVPHEFYGLSKDQKPVGFIGNIQVTNGSLFMEIDTGKIFMFDAENKVWIEQT